MATTAPIPRYLTLDAVRGFAVMGILILNIQGFAMPDGAYFSPAAYGSYGPIDYVAWAFDFILFDSKMRGLFSMLFGASTALVIERAVATGQNSARVHYARMVTLLLFGLIHVYFIWYGDILVLYAVTGLILYLFRNWAVARLRNVGIALIAAQTLLWGAFYVSLLVAQVTAANPATGPKEAAEARETVDAFAGELGMTPEKVSESLALYRGDYPGIVQERLVEHMWSPFTSAIFPLLETLGLMLIGMALYRSGMLTGQWEMARYRKWALVCFAISMPIQAAIAAYMLLDGFSAPSIFGGYIVMSLPFDVIATLGWAALFVGIAKGAADSEWLRRVAATGRAAFSNYLGTSIVMTTIFYGYGLGLFGEFNRATLWLFVLGMWGLMLLWSKPWLTRFRYGPLEWLWRTLARGRVQSMALPARTA